MSSACREGSDHAEDVYDGNSDCSSSSSSSSSSSVVPHLRQSATSRGSVVSSGEDNEDEDDNIETADVVEEEDGDTTGIQLASKKKKLSHSTPVTGQKHPTSRNGTAPKSRPQAAVSSAFPSRASISAKLKCGSSEAVTTPAGGNSSGSTFGPKKQDGFVTKEAAAALLSSCQLTRAEFHDFVCARSFDVFSGGMYRKFLVQSRAAKEAWAFNVQSSICKVQKLSKLMVCVLNSLKLADAECSRRGENADPSASSSYPSLGLAMGSCVNSSTPPVVRQVNAVRAAFARCCQRVEPVGGGVVVRCCVTGAVLDDQCVEVRACSKVSQHQQMLTSAKRKAEDLSTSGDEDHQEDSIPGTMPPPHHPLNPLQPPVVVHQDFEHFFSMLWFSGKIEHVVRHMAKCWMDDFQTLASEGGGSAKETGLEDNQGGAVENEAVIYCVGDKAVGEETHISRGDRMEEAANGSSADGENGLRMQGMCETYSKDNEELIAEMHAAFIYAYELVLESVYAHQSMVDFASRQRQQQQIKEKKAAAAAAGEADAWGVDAEDEQLQHLLEEGQQEKIQGQWTQMDPSNACHTEPPAVQLLSSRAFQNLVAHVVCGSQPIQLPYQEDCYMEGPPPVYNEEQLHASMIYAPPPPP